MGNVSCHAAVTPPQRRLMGFLIVAGAGKSVFWFVSLSMFPYKELIVLSSSSIIEDVITMQKSGLASLAFFYCDFRDDDKKDLRGLLSSLLVQLCRQSDSYCKILSEFYSEHENGSQHPRNDTLVRCLTSLLELPGQAPVYLIVDGLDECPATSGNPSAREHVIGLLKKLVISKLPNVRICVTSRPEMDIKLALDSLTFRSVSLHDESGQIEDINNYIESVIRGDEKNRRWKAEHKQMVIDVLTEKR
jgi:hypothetical protein